MSALDSERLKALPQLFDLLNLWLGILLDDRIYMTRQCWPVTDPKAYYLPYPTWKIDKSLYKNQVKLSTDIHGSNYARSRRRGLWLLGWTIELITYYFPENVNKIHQPKAWMHSDKKLMSTIGNFYSQGLIEYWHHISHNPISLPEVILIYCPVAPLTCCC